VKENMRVIFLQCPKRLKSILLQCVGSNAAIAEDCDDEDDETMDTGSCQSKFLMPGRGQKKPVMKTGI